MNHLKYVLFLLLGVILTLLFSFKSQEPTKEYAYIESFGYNTKIIVNNSQVKENDFKRQSDYNDAMIKIFNEMAMDGWRITASVFNPQHGRHYIYLERTK